MIRRHACLLLLGFLSPVAAVHAQEQGPEPEPAVQEPAAAPVVRDRIELADGKVRYGTVEDFDVRAQVLRLRLDDGEVVTLTGRELHERAVYRLAAEHAPEDDSALQLLAANYARGIGFWKHAGRHYRLALMAAGTIEQAEAVYEEIDRLEWMAASAKLKEGKDALQRRKTDDAVETFEWMLQNVPDQPATVEAGLLYGRILDERAQERRERRARDLAKEVSRALASAEKDFERMEETNRKGLLAGRSKSKAERNFKFATGYGERALRRLDKLVKDDEWAVVNAATELREETRGRVADVLVNLGNHYFTHGEFLDSISACNKALVHVGDHAGAQALRARAQEAERERAQREAEWLLWYRYRLLQPGGQGLPFPR